MPSLKCSSLRSPQLMPCRPFHITKLSCNLSNWQRQDVKNMNWVFDFFDLILWSSTFFNFSIKKPSKSRFTTAKETAMITSLIPHVQLKIISPSQLLLNAIFRISGMRVNMFTVTFASPIIGLDGLCKFTSETNLNVVSLDSSTNWKIKNNLS